MPRGFDADTVAEYLEAIPEHQRASLSAVRAMLLRFIPGVTEKMSYQIPVFTYRGTALVGLSAAQKHCSLHLMSPALAKELDGSLLTGKIAGATLHFSEAGPLDEQTVRFVVERRIREVEGRRSGG